MPAILHRRSTLVYPVLFILVALVMLNVSNALPALAAPGIVATIPVGRNPITVAVNTTTNRIYVANRYSGTLSVINGSTNAVEATIQGYGDWIAVNSVTNRIYTADGRPFVSVFDGSTNTLVTHINMPQNATVLAVNAATNRIYALVRGTLITIDGATNTVIGSPLTLSGRPYDIAVNETTNRIYIANTDHSSLSIIVLDGSTNAQVGTPILVDYVPTSLAVNAITNRLYVLNIGAKSVSVIDGSTNTVIGDPIPVGNDARGLTANTSTNRVYVSSISDDTVTAIDGSTNTVIGTPLLFSDSTWGIAANPATNRIYVTHSGDDTVSVIEDPFTGVPTSTATSIPAYCTPTPTGITTIRDTPGFYDPAYAYWALHLRYYSWWDGRVYSFGPSNNPDSVPLTGDWDGDGLDTVGVYIKSTGVWALSNLTGSVSTTNTYRFPYGPGGSNLTPVVGDWDGDGDDTPGLYDQTTGAWLLINQNASIAPEISFPYGEFSGAVPISGDWDGDGDDTPGVYNPANSAWILSNGLNTAPFASFPYGDSTLKRIKGDFDGNGTDTVGMYNPANRAFLLLNVHASCSPQMIAIFGQDQYYPNPQFPLNMPLMGKWLTNSGGGNAGSGQMNSTPSITGTPTSMPQIAPTFAP